MKNRYIPVLLPACALLLAGCLMSRQYQVVSNIDALAGNQRHDPGLFRDTDAKALGAPPATAESFDTLAAYLAGISRDDIHRARAIWRWITANIDYDTAKKNYTARETLRDRRGTCQGYAELFVELARRVGIRAIEVTGYGRGSDYAPGDRVVNNHAWNAVLAGGRWYLLDCSNGAGLVRNGRFVRDYREHYFFTPPGEFISSHLPELPRWQLLPRKISKREFQDLPYYRHGYFQYGLRQVDDHRTCVITCAKELVLAFEVPAGVVLTIQVRDKSDRKVHEPRMTSANGIMEIRSTFPQPGDYYLIGWASSAARPRDYSWAFTYLVKARY
jgi:hypothetical protein